MATFRVGVGSFNIKDGAVGFGTEIAGLGNLRVKGVTKTTGSIVSGASTLTRYSGFAADNINKLENITLTSEVGTIGDIVVGVNSSIIVSSASTLTVGTVESVSIGTHFSPPVGGVEERGEDFVEGMMRFNTDLNTMEFYNGNEWRQFNYVADIKNSPGSRGRALIFGGSLDYPAGTVTASIDFVTISSKGNALTFGDLTQSRNFTIGCGNETRSLCLGGNTPETDIIDYVTPSSEGDAIDFGNLQSSKFGGGGFSSSTRGFYCGGYDSPADRDIIDYFEIHTLGNALDFGDLTRARRYMSGFASPIRGFNTGGSPSSDTRTIDVFTMASKGNAVNFGDSTAGTSQFCGFSNPTRGIFLTDNPAMLTNLELLNLTSEGNSILFGSLGRNTAAQPTGACNQTRGIVAGGYANPTSTSTNIISFIQILSLGDAQDFGDLVQVRALAGGTSDSHGGLGGY